MHGAHIVAVGGRPAIRIASGLGVATGRIEGDGVRCHHLIDLPPACATATAVAPDLVAAGVHAKVLALRPGSIDNIGLAALVRTRDAALTARSSATYAV